MEKEIQSNEFVMNLFDSLMAAVFNPLQDNTTLPCMPTINAEKYNQASEKEKDNIIKKAINDDAFWGKFFEKIKNKNSYDSLINATKEIDIQIARLNKERWNIIKDWATNT